MSHPVVVTFLILAIIGAMSLAAEVLKPLALSVLLAFALTPLSALFERRARLPRSAAVALTVLLALGAIAGIGYVVGNQLTALANDLPNYREDIRNKLSVLKPKQESALKNVSDVAGDVNQQLFETPVTAAQVERDRISRVVVVQQPSFRERLQTAVGPYLEFLGVGSFVLILVLFMMMTREDLRDRIVALFGRGQVSLTTRTLDEMGQRISRYLATFAAVNSGFGLVIGLGLWAIGVEYAALWGCLAAIMRFIPYVGPAVAFILPLVFSIAHYPGWLYPLEVIVLFAVVETVLNSFLEPVIYGRTTGVSALGLLVAAMFWTWLWGLLGILLSTPLTVCLAVLGKYVPSLGVFATLLGEESELEPDVRFYQRLVALDRDGAVEVVDEALKAQPRAAVFDAILIPALSRAERDAAAGHLDDTDLAFIWRVVGEVVDELEGTPEITLASVAQANTAAAPTTEAAGAGAASPVPAFAPAPRTDGEPASHPVLIGVAVNDTADAVALRMLGQLLAPSGLDLEIIADAATPLALAERVAARGPAMVVLSHLPPEGLTSARYQVRRLRARFADLPIVVGRWGASGHAATAAGRLAEVGASHVALSLADARDHIVSKLIPASASASASASETAPAPPSASTGAGHDLVNVGS
jgi:predicted PurR-regulated permease PerM